MDSYGINDIISQIYVMYESDISFQKAVDALNEIGCMSFMLTKEEIEQMFENGRIIKYDSLCD